MDCENISVWNQLFGKTALLRLTGTEPGAGLSTAHSVQPYVACCHAGSSACEAEAPLVYFPKEFRYE